MTNEGSLISFVGHEMYTPHNFSLSAEHGTLTPTAARGEGSGWVRRPEKKNDPHKRVILLVPLTGFEPATYPLGEGYSIQLSYRGVLRRNEPYQS